MLVLYVNTLPLKILKAEKKKENSGKERNK